MSIAIDFVKNFKGEHQVGRGWNKIPINVTEVKMKIMEIILATRKFN